MVTMTVSAMASGDRGLLADNIDQFRRAHRLAEVQREHPAPAAHPAPAPPGLSHVSLDPLPVQPGPGMPGSRSCGEGHVEALAVEPGRG